ncbi:LysE family translocator [Pseudodesulfovibrio sp.]|uniref:LysE family translocator n=1 Tax=unclassified Pseudodesulfovibrio TaxID=2661612 RepID=UPI003B00CBA6
MEFLTLGLVIGLSAGLSPGPLLALVISETLRHGAGSGVRVALSPLFTDLPLVLVTLLLLSKLSDHQPLLGIIALVGGAFVLSMGIGSLFPKPITAQMQQAAPKSLRKGILVNLLSPHPYLFWTTVGSTLMHRALNQGKGTLIIFLVAFYVALIGSKIGTALLVGRSRAFLSGPFYKALNRLLGLALCILALLLFRDGLQLLGVL